MRLNKTMQRALPGLALLWASSAHAYGDGQVGSFLDQSATWLIAVLGPGVFMLGVIIVGLSMAAGNQDAVRKGGFVMGGGAVIFLARSLVSLLKGWAGGF